MKTLYTIIAFCLVAFSASGQKVAKKDIIGNWEIAAMGEEGALADFDTGEVTVTDEWKKKNPDQDVDALKDKLKRNIEEGGAMGRFGINLTADDKVALQMGGERIEISHKSSNRSGYAQGSLRAVRFLAGQKTGMFDMFDVLDLK